MDKIFFNNLVNRIKPCFEEGTSHEFSHTERVLNNALMLSKGENVDLDIIKAASLLHDIARINEDSGEIKSHSEEGAKRSEQILKELNFPEEKINQVMDCIFTHSYNNGLKAKSREGEILQDADRLDVLGAMGIGRTFFRACEKKQPMNFSKLTNNSSNESIVERFDRTVLARVPKNFNTEKAKKIAEDRYDYSKDFIKRFEMEIKGEA